MMKYTMTTIKLINIVTFLCMHEESIYKTGTLYPLVAIFPTLLTTVLLFYFIYMTLLDFTNSEILQFSFPFGVWLHLAKMSSKFIHVVANGGSPFQRVDNNPLCVCVYTNLFDPFIRWNDVYILGYISCFEIFSNINSHSNLV